MTPPELNQPVLKPGIKPHTPSRESDYRLTIDTVAKIAQAQKRGTLSSTLHIRRLPTQIVLENTTESDRAWVLKHFPDGEMKRQAHGAKKVGRRRYDTYHYVVDLREKVGERDYYLPWLEVWNILRPHECRNFLGFVSEDGQPPYWRCGAYGCRKRIPVTKARALGLLPERSR